MWGKQGHEMLRGQSCCRIRGAGAQQLGVQGWSEQESSSGAALGRYREVVSAGVGRRRKGWRKGEELGAGEELGVLSFGRKWWFW